MIDSFPTIEILDKNKLFKFIEGFKNDEIQSCVELGNKVMVIFRTHFLRKHTIPQLSGQISKDIRDGYTGGAVDMYIPYNEDNTKIYCYDVNSLYPYVMKEFDMPVGKPTLFYGDIRKVDPNTFGFFYCKIIAPDNLEHPIIQTHVKTESGMRTIAPLGTWTDMVFSAEMDNAIKYGYKFEILWGYKFKPKNIFKEYVETHYELRLTYLKSNPLNYIAKLLMNSLYGRFGMIDQFPEILIFDSKKSFNEFAKVFSEDILNTIDLGDKLLVKYISEDAKRSTMLYGNLETHNVSIAIAAAITAYARIHMSQFKNNLDYKLYYSDTDSAYFDKPLAKDMVSNTILGKMKLENVLTKAIFLAPKTYCLLTEDDKLIYKVKGFSHDIELTMDDFESLLFKESVLKKLQTKWNKHISEGHIKVIDQLYTLKVTENKRKLIYDNNNKLITTVPYVINKDKEIINK
jgi:DNA polymerase type B, organellar and viral